MRTFLLLSAAAGCQRTTRVDTTEYSGGSYTISITPLDAEGWTGSWSVDNSADSDCAGLAESHVPRRADSEVVDRAFFCVAAPEVPSGCEAGGELWIDLGTDAQEGVGELRLHPPGVGTEASGSIVGDAFEAGPSGSGSFTVDLGAHLPDGTCLPGGPHRHDLMVEWSFPDVYETTTGRGPRFGIEWRSQ